MPVARATTPSYQPITVPAWHDHRGRGGRCSWGPETDTRCSFRRRCCGQPVMAAGGRLDEVESDEIYDDGLVRLDADAITLRHYYFPVGAAKRIPYAHVRDVEHRPMG